MLEIMAANSEEKADSRKDRRTPNAMSENTERVLEEKLLETNQNVESFTIPTPNSCKHTNGRGSFQLFVGVFDTSLVWYLLVLPSETHTVSIMTSLRSTDGNTSNHLHASFSLLPWISAERRVVERVEPVVVGDHDVGVLVEEEGQHVVALLGDGVVQRSVALGILG